MTDDQIIEMQRNALNAMTEAFTIARETLRETKAQLDSIRMDRAAEKLLAGAEKMKAHIRQRSPESVPHLEPMWEIEITDMVAMYGFLFCGHPKSNKMSWHAEWNAITGGGETLLHKGDRLQVHIVRASGGGGGGSG